MPLEKTVFRVPVARLILLIFALLSLSQFTFSQTKPITGTILDENGKPVSGASVVVRNRSGGTSTNPDGKFTVSALAEDSLEISFVGYETMTVLVGTDQNPVVRLKSSAAGNLSDVIVVGYGTQKKRNVTGAISTVTAADIDSRPVTNASSALAGLAPGVSVRQGSGDPRGDGATIRIRGIGTLNNSTPLFLVDGIQVAGIDNINPADIESISLLKDAASASIYGALGANGVVLVTTKKGSRGRTVVSYNGMFSMATPSNMLDLVDNSPRFMRLVNQSSVNLGIAPVYSNANINTWDSVNRIPNELNPNGVPNYVAYPNTNWFEQTFDRTLVQNHNISVSGGSDKSTYLLSFGYLDNPGTLPNSGLKRYQLRANVEAKPTKFLTIGTQTFASVHRSEKGNTGNYFNFLWQATPMVYPYYNGRFGGKVADADPVTAENPLRQLYTSGGRDLSSRINTTLYANVNLNKGLVFESRFNYQTLWDESNNFPVPYPRFNLGTNVQLDPDPAANLATQTVSYSLAKFYTYTLDQILRYNKTFGTDHELSAFVGYNEYYSNDYSFGTTKQGLLDYSIYTLDGAITPISASGGESDWSLQSVFGRLNYAFRKKYLFEGNFRKDGTSQFSPDKRWGTFASFSGGWVISEEKFFEGLKDKVNNLKLRGSWGTLGNNRMDVNGARQNYLWQAAYGPVIYSFNNVQANGVVQGIFANPNLLWETTEASNIGLDMTLFNGSLDLTVEGYYKRAFDILTRPDVSLTAGTRTAPFVNGPEVVNKGIEVNALWRKNIGDLRLSIGGNFTYNHNEITRYKGEFIRGYVRDANGNLVYSSNMGAAFSDPGSLTPIVQGRMIGDYFAQTVYRGDGSYFNGDGSVNINGGPKDGMIRTQADLDWINAMKAANYRFSPVNNISKTQLYLGDLIYADNNGDSIYGNTHDRMFVNASSNPKFLVGFNLNANWKGFDFSMLWAGAFGMQYYWNQAIYNNTTTRLGNAVSERVAGNSYYFNEANRDDPENRINGSMPRMKWINDPINNVSSNFWLYDGSYLRLKNVQLGYTFPARVLQRAYITSARLFLTGENLLTITNFPGLDPEIGANVGYPTMKQFTLGVNLTF